MNKSEAEVGLKVHTLGRGDRVFYIISLGDKTAEVSTDRDAKSGFGIMYERLVKFKNQN